MAAVAAGDRHAQPPARKGLSYPCWPDRARSCQEIPAHQVAPIAYRRRALAAEACRVGGARDRARLRKNPAERLRQGAGELASPHGAILGTQGELIARYSGTTSSNIL